MISNFILYLLVCHLVFGDNNPKHLLLPDQKEQHQIDSILRWSPDRKLTIEDFWLKDSTSISMFHHKAAAFSTVTFLLDIKIIDKKNIIKGEAVFFKTSSWFSNKAPGHALKHEQAHFDIAEIYARKFTAQMKQFEDYRNPDMMNKIFAIYDEMSLEHLKEQQEFDRYALSDFGLAFYYEKIEKQLAAQQ